MNEQAPLPRAAAARSVVRCAVTTVGLLCRRRTHLRHDLVGTRLRFADGTSALVFRETAVDRDPPGDPCLLLVEFRLRLLHGRWHRLFLVECILNTPLFVGFPGFVSKLWLGPDESESYRGLYEWNDPDSAGHYARSLWRVLELVCVPGSIRYRVLPALRRDAVLATPWLHEAIPPEGESPWWQLVGAE